MKITGGRVSDHTSTPVATRSIPQLDRVRPLRAECAIGRENERKAYIYHALPYFLGFVCLGLAGASYGPALPHLARNTGTGLSAISLLFVAHRMGFVAGALGAGQLYDRIPGNTVIGFALIVMASALAILPLTTSLAALLAVALVAGFMAGGVDVGGNVLTVWRIRSGLGSFMSFLHFSFGVGTFLAPVILAQSVAWSNGIRWGYWCLAIASLPVAILVMRRPSPEPHPSDDNRDGSRPNRALVGLTTLFLMLYVAAEVGFGNWIYTYALEQGLANQVSAGYLTSAYWGAYTLGRLASVVVSARVRPGLLLGAALGTAGASVLLLLILPASGALTWVCTMVFGVALAPIFPVMVTFAGERTMITGGVTSLFLVGASVGAMSLPWLIGQAFGPYGPTVVPALVLIDVLLLVGVFLIVTVRYGQASTT